jgi:hypothetical protein
MIRAIPLYSPSRSSGSVIGRTLPLPENNYPGCGWNFLLSDMLYATGRQVSLSEISQVPCLVIAFVHSVGS